MAKSIEPKLRKIGDYLKLEENAVFTIPEYQRAYSWGIPNCDKLWQDIIDFVEAGSKDRYFFGTIIINCQDGDTKLSLIDGQQRTVTFLLLLKALLIRINEVLKSAVYDDESEPLFRGLQERRRKIMGILYKAESEEISNIPDKERDSLLFYSTTVLENHSINEQYKTEFSTILQTFYFEDAANKVIQIKYKQKDRIFKQKFQIFPIWRRDKICGFQHSDK